jgi:hypothetical protein
VKYKELSANTVAFIDCRRRLTKVLAGVARGKKGSKGRGGRVRLLDVLYRKTDGIEVHVDMPFSNSQLSCSRVASEFL